MVLWLRLIKRKFAQVCARLRNAKCKNALNRVKTRKDPPPPRLWQARGRFLFPSTIKILDFLWLRSVNSGKEWKRLNDSLFSAKGIRSEAVRPAKAVRRDACSPTPA